MFLPRMFLEHPRSVNETYGQHMASALSFAGPLFVASLACFTHAFLPFLFTTTASGKVRALYGRMVVNRVRQADTNLQPAAGD